MEERSLKWVAILVLILGIPALYIYEGGNQDPISETSFSGRVSSISQKGDITLLRISRSIPVVLEGKVVIPCGSTVQVQGMYKEYEGNDEFVASAYSLVKEGKPSACARGNQ